MYKTEAWVLSTQYEGLKREFVSFPELLPEEVLVKPIYGCFEGNMMHAVEKSPIDLNKERQEERIVLGNAGVVQILKLGNNIDDLKVGECCIYFCNGLWDEYGYPIKIAGYDCKSTIGLLAKQTKVHRKQLILIPRESSFTLQQWAAFSLRYITAWANWKIAYSCYNTQMPLDAEQINVFAWGGGVSFAELTLSLKLGCKAFMIASGTDRLDLLKRHNIYPIDRLSFNRANFEEEFLAKVYEVTNGKMASIFIDNIGGRLFQLTLKSLARQGLITTCGWKDGAVMPFVRSIECINRHIFVHTHYAKYNEGLEAVKYAIENDWIPEIVDYPYNWEEIDKLLVDYKEEKIDSYFPIYKINDLA